MTTADWHPFEYELKYRLGEITLGRQRLKVLRKVYSLNDIRNFVDDPEFPGLDANLDGYLLANIPRECVTGTIETKDTHLRYCLQSYMRCYIDMSGDFEAYQAKFSSKTRSGLNRKVRKFVEQAGGQDFRCYRTPEDISRFFKLARPVSAASYQERLLDCGLPSDAEFISAATAAAARDEVRAFLLFAHGEPVSYLYCPEKDGVLEYAFLGYISDFGKLSPGTVLQWLALETLFAEKRYTAFDFTEGESEHKRFFSTHQTPCSLQLLLRPSLRARIGARLHRCVDATSKRLGDSLESFGLKRRIKNWMRRAA